MKAIALIVVQGGVAEEFAPEHVDVRIVDIDNIKASAPGTKVFLPSDIGFEELVFDASVEEYVEFV